MPIFRVKSVKIYTGQKNLHEYVRGVRDKYEVCTIVMLLLLLCYCYAVAFCILLNQTKLEFAHDVLHLLHGIVKVLHELDKVVTGIF